MPDGQISPHDPERLLALNAALRTENENLRAIVATLKRALYGARSEKQAEPASQLPLGLDDLSATPVEPVKLPAPANSNRPPRPQAVRNIGGLPAHLPRVDITIEPQSKACPCCEGKLHQIGEDVSEMLDVVPAILRSYAMDDRPWCGPAPPAAVYLYAEDRKGRHVDEHLLRFNGVLPVDAYAGYNRLTERNRAGGESWAILASLINSAKLHDLDPQTYLADVLERIVSGQTKVNALVELLPWHWKAARAERAQAA